MDPPRFLGAAPVQMKSDGPSPCATEIYKDILVVGAGISGIGAAYYIKNRLPASTTFEVLDRNADLGGTWRLFKYPGCRTDSDMFSFSYAFHPWKSAVQFATAAEILSYLNEVVDVHDLRSSLRFNAHVVSADFSTVDSLWRLETVSGQRYCCRYLMMCAGYYDVDAGFTPTFPGSDEFKGTIVHTQQWPEDEGINCTGKRVVVVGSGATAITLIPAIAKTAKHVTMLQRSPTYIVGDRSTHLPTPWLAQQGLARLGPWFAAAYWGAARLLMVTATALYYKFCKMFPSAARAMTLKLAARRLRGSNVDMVHFSPRYKVWDQRVCFAPDGDFFTCIRRGTASVVTAQLERFSSNGIILAPGSIAEEGGAATIDADIVILATGLNIAFLGKTRVSIDGVAIDVSDHLAYKGFMLDDVPNLFFVVGYTNASWTLKVDLVCQMVCGLLSWMKTWGFDTARPHPPRAENEAEREEMFDFTSSYVQRAKHLMPKQGAVSPWRVHQNYFLDWIALRLNPIDDGVLDFSNSPRTKANLAQRAAAQISARL